MRAVLLILILAVVAIIALVASGLIDINQVRGARAPTMEATGNGVSARGGQTPAFDVETGSVTLETREANVAVPKLKVEKGTTQVSVPTMKVNRPDDEQQNAATNTSR